MAASSYLLASEYAAYGVPNATAAQVQQASGLVDAYLHRPEGLVWGADAAGNPAYMAASTALWSGILPSSITAGSNIVVAWPQATQDLIGETVLIDRSNGAAIETCVITAAVTGVSFTLGTVTYAHALGATLEFGLCITEERELPARRSITRVSRNPIAKIVSGMGRYGYGRRSDQMGGLYSEMNLLAAIQTFGGPPAWVPWDARQASVSQATGEVWVPAGLLLAYYSEIRLRYLAGWPASNLPPVIKQATASIVLAVANSGDLTGQITKMKAGGTSIERAAAGLLDNDTQRALEAYRARSLY